MPDLAFDFTWYRDPKGYRLIPAKPLMLRPGKSILDVPSRDIVPARIVRNGGVLQPYRPLEKFPNLFSHFIDTAKSEEDMLRFVESFGPLTRDGLGSKGEVVTAVSDQAKNMLHALRGRIIAMPLAALNASIVTNGGMRLKVSPACLLDALWLQLAQRSKTGLRECRQCRGSFVVGSGRRTDAKFCSDKCRIAFNSLKRSR